MTTTHAKDSRRSTPSDFSWKTWRHIIKETWNAIGSKDLQLYAAGISYFSILSFFPLVAMIVALAGLVIQPHQLDAAVTNIAQYLPHDVAALVTTQLHNAVSHRSASFVLLFVSIILSLVGISGAVGNMMTALNHSYEVKETRRWYIQRFVSVALTLFLVIGGMLLGAVFVGGSKWLHTFGVPHEIILAASWLRWVLMIVGAMVGLGIMYRFGPSRTPTRRWQWVSWGAIVATILWIIVTALFFVYLQYFGNYTRNYSTYAGIIGLMVWLNYSALIVLIGAVINNHLEHRRRL